MRPYGTSSADGEIDAVLRSEPPVEGATLQGWVALTEWMKPGGEPMLVLMGKPEASLLQMKAYLHTGLLHMVWKGVRRAPTVEIARAAPGPPTGLRDPGRYGEAAVRHRRSLSGGAGERIAEEGTSSSFRSSGERVVQ